MNLHDEHVKMFENQSSDQSAAGPPGEVFEDPTGNENGSTFWYQANPFYLISVFMMFLGLWLAVQASHAGTLVETILAFQGVQHLYEFVMLGMAVYLLRNVIQPEHGKYLLLFIILFLGDVTFFQVRITAMAAAGGQYALAVGVLGVNLLLATAKLGLAVKFLRLRFNLLFAIQGLGTLALLAFAPLAVYWRFDSAVSGTAGETVAFQGHWEVYLLWLLAAALPLPLIVHHWQKDVATDDQGYMDGLLFWKVFSIVPFFLLPVSLMANVHADIATLNPEFVDTGYCLIPWLLTGTFYTGIFFRSTIERVLGMANWDFFALTMILLMDLALRPGNALFGNVNWTPLHLNQLMVISGHLLCGITRRNTACLGVSGLALLGHGKDLLLVGGEKSLQVVQELSYVAWAAFTMVISFISLGTGFLFSLNGRKKVETRG